MIKCDLVGCKNNNKKICTLVTVTLCTDGCGAYCDSFKESDKSKQSAYKLYKIEDDLYVAIRQMVMKNVDIMTIIKEINPNKNIRIIVDNLIYCGSAKNTNRFWICDYDNNKKDIVKFTNEEFISRTSDLGKTIRKLTCDYLRNSKNYGCLVSTSKKMIEKGMNI